MKMILVSILMLMLPMELMAQNSLTVTLADGTQRVFQLSERPELLWEGDNIIISTATTELAIPRTNFKGFNVNDASAIETVKNGGSRVTVDADGKLRAEGLKVGSTIRVYDAAGRQVSQQTVSADGCAIVNLSKQPTGTYIVKIDNQSTLKILKP